MMSLPAELPLGMALSGTRKTEPESRSGEVGVHSEPTAEPDGSIMAHPRLRGWPSFGQLRGTIVPFAQTSRRVMSWASSHFRTLAHTLGSRSSQALTLGAPTIMKGNLSRWAAWTNRAKSVRELRSSLTSSSVVMIGLLVMIGWATDVERRLTDSGSGTRRPPPACASQPASRGELEIPLAARFADPRPRSRR